MSSANAYTNITPAAGLLQGNSRPVTFTLLNEAGTGVAGEKANITLYVVEPSGSYTVAGSSLTDNGDGTYEYTVLFDEAGYTFGDFYYESGDIKIRTGWAAYVEARKTSAAQ